jgi:hypothetical protein
MEYVYLLREREFKNLNQPIYKIGKSKQINCQRITDYPKNSELVVIVSLKDCNKTENIIIDLFKNEFKQRLDIGNEYFQGNVKKMKLLFYKLAIYELENDFENESDGKLENNPNDKDMNKDDETDNDDEVGNNDGTDKDKKCISNTIDIDEKIKMLILNKRKNKIPRYECEKCDYYTDKTSNYKQHLESIKHLDNHNIKNKDIILQEKQFQCEYCKKIYANKTNKSNHNGSCKAKKKYDKKIQIEEYNKQMAYEYMTHTMNNTTTVNQIKYLTWMESINKL